MKIGVTSAPLNRLAQLQTSHPERLEIVRLMTGGRAAERMVHKAFATVCLHGEWFEFSPDMMTQDFGCADLPLPEMKQDDNSPGTYTYVTEPCERPVLEKIPVICPDGREGVMTATIWKGRRVTPLALPAKDASNASQ